METISRITDKLIVIVHVSMMVSFYVSGFRYFTYLPNQSNVRCITAKIVGWVIVLCICSLLYLFAILRRDSSVIIFGG